MRKGLEERALGLLRRAAIVLLALGLLGALAPAAPALAFEAEVAAGAGDCCTPPPVQVCQQSSPLADGHAQTPPFPAVIGKAVWRERILPPLESAAAPGAPVTRADPPAYLRFHRFLL